MKRRFFLFGILLFAYTSKAQVSSDDAHGDNLITVSPFVGYATPQISDLGIGLGYERFITEYISAKLPLNFGLITDMFQTGIGLKFYPAGHNRTVKYALGPTILFTRSADGYVVEKFDSMNNFWYQEKVTNPLTQFGFALTNSLNVTIQKHIYIGAEMGLGLNYLNNYRDDPIQTGVYREEEPNVLFLFTLNMGYRF